MQYHRSYLLQSSFRFVQGLQHGHLSYIHSHVAATGSKLGTKVLDDFDYYLPHFKKLIPNEYKKMITLSAKLEEKGLTSEQAQMEAFYESIGAKH